MRPHRPFRRPPSPRGERFRQQPGGRPEPADDVAETLALGRDLGLRTRDQDRGGTKLGVEIGGPRFRVRAGIDQRDQIAAHELRYLAGFTEQVDGAERADDVGDLRGWSLGLVRRKDVKVPIRCGGRNVTLPAWIPSSGST